MATRGRPQVVASTIAATATVRAEVRTDSLRSLALTYPCTDQAAAAPLPGKSRANVELWAFGARLTRQFRESTGTKSECYPLFFLKAGVGLLAGLGLAWLRAASFLPQGLLKKEEWVLAWMNVCQRGRERFAGALGSCRSCAPPALKLAALRL